MSKLAKQYQWKKISNNYILAIDIDGDRYISYNPNTGASHLGAFLGGFVGQSGEETALVDRLNEEHEFRILVGDWRDDYEKLAPLGFEACIEFFMQKRAEYGGQWSTHEKDRASAAPSRSEQ